MVFSGEVDVETELSTWLEASCRTPFHFAAGTPSSEAQVSSVLLVAGRMKRKFSSFHGVS